MRTFTTVAAFASAANALVSRGESCCFGLSSSGSESGPIGQLDDGQCRVHGDLPPGEFCIDSNGGITDDKGRGCILTPPTSQFQCDEGSNPTPGFSIGQDGSLLYKGEKCFVACHTGMNGGMNLYTESGPDQTGCKEIELNADSCHNTPSSPEGPGQPSVPSGGDSSTADMPPTYGTSAPGGDKPSSADQPPTYGSTSHPSNGGPPSMPPAIPPGHTVSTVSETEVVTVPCETDKPDSSQTNGIPDLSSILGGSTIPGGGEFPGLMPTTPKEEDSSCGGESSDSPSKDGDTGTSGGGESILPSGNDSTNPSGDESTDNPKGEETPTTPGSGQSTYPTGGESNDSPHEDGETGASPMRDESSNSPGGEGDGSKDTSPSGDDLTNPSGDGGSGSSPGGESDGSEGTSPSGDGGSGSSHGGDSDGSKGTSPSGVGSTNPSGGSGNSPGGESGGSKDGDTSSDGDMPNSSGEQSADNPKGGDTPTTSGGQTTYPTGGESNDDTPKGGETGTGPGSDGSGGDGSGSHSSSDSTDNPKGGDNDTPGGGGNDTPGGGETPGGESNDDTPKGGETGSGSGSNGPGSGVPGSGGSGGEMDHPSGNGSTDNPKGGDNGGGETTPPPGGGDNGGETTAVHPPPSYPTSDTPGHDCATDLTGDYEYPHLIIPIDSSKPSETHGTSYNGVVSATKSSLFNFDIPPNDAGKTCSLVFLFPKKEDLETADYDFNGDGKLGFSSLESPATESTNYNNCPDEKTDFGEIDVEPGNSYVVSTFKCPAGETVGYKIDNAGSTDLEFFEDYNPSPLGLYITVC